MILLRVVKEPLLLQYLRRIIPIHITPRNIVIPISIVGNTFEAINNINENLLPQSQS
jgi:hypothetical protein